MKTPHAIYVHIPFCKARCSYCAFSSCVDFDLCKRYFETLFSEIENARPCGAIYTMFWGGGTPSSVPVEFLDELYTALSKKFDLSKLTEFTVECNPESATPEMLTFLKSIGVNRISFGVQSVNDETLKRIGRLHTYDGFLQALATARSLGFENVNADLILGLPETERQFRRTVDVVSQLDLQHVSLYALEIHQSKGAFVNLCKKFAFSDDQLADLYDYAREKFAEKGLLRYEVSNFAKAGKECQHNLTYWRENRYYGFGASASGFLDDVRYTNAYGLRDYIKCGRNGAWCEISENLTQSDEMYEFVMLGLRLQRGFLASEFAFRYGKQFVEVYPAATKLCHDGFLEMDGDVVRVPDDKFYVLNSILVELLG